MTWEGGGTMKRLRCYSDDGYDSSNSNGRTAHIQVGCQQFVEDDDFLDEKKDDNNQQEI
jgi:hypothetical protein